MSFPARLISRLAPLLALALAAAACHVTPYQRSLPEWIQRVYVPMAINKSYEPGLEELVTKSLQSEIAADGRLEVARKRAADAVVQVEILSFGEAASDFDNDDIASRNLMTLNLEVKLFDPKDMENPIGKIAPLKVVTGYSSNYRSTSAELSVDARDRLGESAGLQILRALMTQTVMNAP